MFMFMCLAAIDGWSISRRTRDYAVVGVLAGLAFATKYTAWILAVPILAAHAYRLGRAVASWRSIAELVLIGAAGFAAFAVTNPYAFIRWSDFVYWGFWFN